MMIVLKIIGTINLFSLLTKKYDIFGKSSLIEAINVERNRGGTSKLNGRVYKYKA